MIGVSLTSIETKYWCLAMYGALAVAFAFIPVEAVNSEWSGIDELHTVLEASAAIVGLVVGAMAFTRHDSHPEAKYLWMVVGFIGAGLLDGFHKALTTRLSADYFPTLLDTAAKWPEFALCFICIVLSLLWLTIGSGKMPLPSSSMSPPLRLSNKKFLRLFGGDD